MPLEAASHKDFRKFDQFQMIAGVRLGLVKTAVTSDHRAVSSAVERCLDMAKVRGSIPLLPTKLRDRGLPWEPFFVASYKVYYRAADKVPASSRQRELKYFLAPATCAELSAYTSLTIDRGFASCQQEFSRGVATNRRRSMRSGA